jgi:hypothetical protein
MSDDIFVPLRRAPDRATTILLLIGRNQFARTSFGLGKIYDVRDPLAGRAYTPPRWVRDMIEEFIRQGLTVDDVRRQFRMPGGDETRTLTLLSLSPAGEAEAYLRWNADLDRRLKAATDE